MNIRQNLGALATDQLVDSGGILWHPVESNAFHRMLRYYLAYLGSLTAEHAAVLNIRV